MNFLENLFAGFVAALQGPGILIMIGGVAWESSAAPSYPFGPLLLHLSPTFFFSSFLLCSPEVFTLALFGLTLIAGLSGPSFLKKGLASGFFGLLLTTVGMDTLTGALRFTFRTAGAPDRD